MSLVKFVSSLTLENWDWRNPWSKGIGGSETSHIEMAGRLKNRGYDVVSYAPVAKPSKDNYGVSWHNIDKFHHSKGVSIIYRDPQWLDLPKTKGMSWWFVAQDVDYDGLLIPERLAKVDRYLCLCQDHLDFTLKKYPMLQGKAYVSSNGIRSDYIRDVILPMDIKRNRNRMFYASSPDRGLKFLLEQWFRVKEINPKAELLVAYGFDNMEAIVKAAGQGDWRYGYQKELEQLIRQPGITFTGRLNQRQIYETWRSSNIWSHPTNFPETSCITCMEAQALGAWPVTNKFWAIKRNVKAGWMVDGIPQESALTRSNWLHTLEEAFHSNNEKYRKEMMKWALENHDWENVVRQWSVWLDEDLKK